MSQYFPKPYEPFGTDIKVKVEDGDGWCSHVRTLNFEFLTRYLSHNQSVIEIFISVLCSSFIICIVSSIAISVDAGSFRSC